ncbi:MAG TPA: hypothetical protein VJR89_06590 [Polyangiales bacterium]|nr:hypothetical protein [Polyangiales bacterium]
MAKFERPLARRVAIALGLLLVAPCLLSGFTLDDFALLEQLSNHADKRWAGSAPFDLFRWVDPAHTHALMDRGGLSWWLYDRALLSFMRPLSSLSHSFDYALWPNSAFAAHLHSWLWFALLLVAAAAAYRSLIANRWTAGVAAAMFALDSAHGATVSWISNRNALISGTFAIAALLCHHRARSGAGRSYAWLAWLSLGASLFASELGVSGAAFLAAYALWYERGAWKNRALSLAPYALVIFGWAAARGAGQYGSIGGFASYVDPLHEPVRFLAMLPGRVIMLIASQLTHLSADLYSLSDLGVRPFVLAAGVLGCAALGWFLWPSLRNDRTSRFFCLAGVLSALPLAGSMAADRLLTLVGFGLLPALADAMRRALDVDVAAFGQRIHPLRTAAAVLLVLLHLMIDPLVLPATSLATMLYSEQIEMLADSIPVPAGSTDRVVIVAEMPHAGMFNYVASMRRVRGKPEARLYSLFGAEWEARFERRGERVLRVTSERGFFSPNWDDRSPQLPLAAGERIELSELSIHVLDVTPDGRPARVDFEFREPLESARYVWMTWQTDRLVPFRPPEDGEPEVVAGR